MKLPSILVELKKWHSSGKTYFSVRLKVYFIFQIVVFEILKYTSNGPRLRPSDGNINNFLEN